MYHSIVVMCCLLLCDFQKIILGERYNDEKCNATPGYTKDACLYECASHHTELSCQCDITGVNGKLIIMMSQV